MNFRFPRISPVVAVVLLAISFGVPKAAARTPEEALQTLLSSPSIDRAQTAVFIWDLDADYQVAAHNASVPVTPASVMKCVTVAALGNSQPYDSRIPTKVWLEGVAEGDAFTGVLTVEGAGDPSLGDGRHEGQPDFVRQIASALSSRGIRSLRGEVRVDNSLFAGSPVHPSWPDSDLREAYGTGCHAFNFEGNASGKKSVADPAAVFRRRLSDALKAEGIEMEPREVKSPEGRKTLILEYQSPALGELMRSCMYRSDNLYAETFLRLFGVRNGADGSVGRSAALAMQHWDALCFPIDDIEIADGSGLSRDNRLTAQFLGMVLRSRGSDPEYVSFFPLVGEEGTVKSFMKDTPLKGRMALKTGSMSGIQSYAGYLLDDDYMPSHVVVVMTNGLKNRAEFRAALSRFFLEVFR